MKEEKLKHLEFIQNIITRHNSNSFQLKGLCITIVAAILAIYASNAQKESLIVAIASTLLFWFLDTYYLQQERKLRGLYNDVAGLSSSPKVLRDFEIRPDLYVGNKYSYTKVFFSKTISSLYIAIVVGLLLTYFS